eukprot:TRINITY_DN62_c0_g1_i2.p1 TRINITY_DN62_c0_g1~~TRINITY_DN62_c0_g1_i2.p1  ORF type:complete len:120 (+),score=6.37 TRINITY_DN62_c0_g1_i2:149-508(+)
MSGMSSSSIEMIYLCTVDEIGLGKIKKVKVNNKLTVAVCRAPDDKIFVIQNKCSHQGYPLHRGKVKKSCNTYFINCKAHNIEYDLETGLCPEIVEYRQKVFKFSIKGENEIWLKYKGKK